MEADIAQIKLLVWVILGLLVFFVISNLLCKIFNCGEGHARTFNKLLDQGKFDLLITKSQHRLKTQPYDVPALYFGGMALAAMGRYEEARSSIRRLMTVSPALHKQCTEDLEAFDRMERGS